MKKIFLIILIFLLLIIVALLITKFKENDNMIEFKKGEYYNKNWDEAIGTYNIDIVQNEKTALEIAVAIYNNLNNNDRKMKPTIVFFDEVDEVWIITFEKIHNNEITLGGNCNIALRKKDGKVLRIWYEE